MSARAISLTVLTLLLVAGALSAQEPVKVVYHLNEGLEQASRAMGNIQNHLAAEPGTRIVVVAHGRGIDFLLKDAKEPTGGAFSNHIDELSVRGVEFRVCRFTLERRKIDSAKLVPEAKIIPSGVAEVARLQAREHFAYVKP
jgi:intracellular sulfur oxidation DsrE/DsrF family protein